MNEEMLSIPKLGFGLMRLPKNADGTICMEETCEMVDAFLDAGMVYFDTAYVYDQGNSELAARDALVRRHPRDSFLLATKMNAWLGHPDKETVLSQFETSLERTEAGYFDFYLLHALQDENWKIYEDYGIWDFVRKEKENGRIRHWGFSCHSSPEVLEMLLTDHPDAEFVQLQINYADWENPKVNSRKCLEIAARHKKPVIIMEPVKGGALANPEPAVKNVFDSLPNRGSYASYALRFAAGLEGIITVLSGMSNMEQLQDNLSFMNEFKPLDEAEEAAVQKARKTIEQSRLIPCTACHYCTDGCPENIPIPEIFRVKNQLYSTNDLVLAKESFSGIEAGKGKPSECIECGQCEGACPQSLSIIQNLKESIILEK